MHTSPHRRTNDADFKVGKFGDGLYLIVFIRDIAPAHDGYSAVSSEGFVVHPAVHPRKLGRWSQCFGSGSHRGVEHPHLNVWMRVEQSQSIIRHSGKDIVQQKANAHATVCRIQQGSGNQCARQILFQQKVLQIDCMFIGFGNPQPRTQCLVPLKERNKRTMRKVPVASQYTGRLLQAGRSRRDKGASNRLGHIEGTGAQAASSTIAAAPHTPTKRPQQGRCPSLTFISIPRLLGSLVVGFCRRHRPKHGS